MSVFHLHIQYSAAQRLRDKLETLNPGDQLRIGYTNHRMIRQAATDVGKHVQVLKTGETAFSDRFGKHVPVWLVTVL